MKKERRIKKNEEFQEIIQSAEKKTSALYVLYYRKKKEEKNRIGIAVPKKLGHAVDRNLIKRQVRMIVEECGALEKDLDMIVVVRKGYDVKDYQKSKNSFQTMLNHITMENG